MAIHAVQGPIHTRACVRHALTTIIMIVAQFSCITYTSLVAVVITHTDLDRLLTTGTALLSIHTYLICAWD